MPPDYDHSPTSRIGPRPDREWLSGGVRAVGTALAAFGAWPRRGPVGP